MDNSNKMENYEEIKTLFEEFTVAYLILKKKTEM